MIYKLKRNKIYMLDGIPVKIIAMSKISVGYIITYERHLVSCSKGKVKVVDINSRFRELTLLEKELL